MIAYPLRRVTNRPPVDKHYITDRLRMIFVRVGETER